MVDRLTGQQPGMIGKQLVKEQKDKTSISKDNQIGRLVLPIYFGKTAKNKQKSRKS